MKKISRIISLAAVLAATAAIVSCEDEMTVKNRPWKVSVAADHTIRLTGRGVKNEYHPEFTVIFSPDDPAPAMRPAGIPDVLYNAVTWKSEGGDAAAVKRTDDQTGDGFDDSILDGATTGRTFSLFGAGENIPMKPSAAARDGGRILFSYPENEKFALSASLYLDEESGYPALEFELTPKQAGYFSVGYTGYQPVDTFLLDRIWQPLIWQEKRFPDRSYLTMAFRTPVGGAFTEQKGVSRSVIAHPGEYPFDPLPTSANSRFGVALRTADGKASPMLFAPVPGGAGSQMEAGESYTFRALLFACEGKITDALQEAATEIYGFSGYRTNAGRPLNNTIENMIDYSLSTYAWFIDDEKGCAYSTDVPGAVKNVSSLNPIEIALINDNPEMYLKRGYPILEYMLSREKFLFTADSTQKIQFPSRRLDGPCAPISEMTTLYSVYGHRNPFLIRFAEDEYGKTRVRNLDVPEKGARWQNALQLYKATGERQWLDQAVEGADLYLKERVAEPQRDFSDKDSGGGFFWTGFTPRWIDLLELYETTGDQKYLAAAHEGAREYTQFIWFSPSIPDGQVLVNPEGKAPHYAYLKQKGHAPMDADPESVPAWRLSEIGLTPESSGTSTGHRGIFMANYAAWMMRIAHYTGDRFLADVAKNAVIGRYANFPGYHINTARTTVYEKEDYPLRGHKELGVNSFHYNHIMPMISLLYDYLVSDVLYRSGGKIHFPDELIEAYAYLQSKFYGHAPGTFYGEQAWLWMPSGLAQTSDKELNYLSARGEDGLFMAFSNQCGNDVSSVITLNPGLLGLQPGKEYEVIVMSPEGSASPLTEGQFEVHVPAHGLAAVKIGQVLPKTRIQEHIVSGGTPWKKDYAASSDQAVRCMVLDLGDNVCNLYAYLTVEDTQYRSASIEVNGIRMTDAVYPYEFTVPAGEASRLKVNVSAVLKQGGTKTWETLILKK